MLKGFAEKLKTLREDNGFTQSELARKLQVSRACVSSWEMELTNPSTDNVLEIAKLFNVSTDYLMGMDAYSSISVNGLVVSDVSTVYNIVNRLRK